MIPAYDAVTVGVLVGVSIAAVYTDAAISIWRERRVERAELAPQDAAASAPPRLAAARRDAWRDRKGKAGPATRRPEHQHPCSRRRTR